MLEMCGLLCAIFSASSRLLARTIVKPVMDSRPSGNSLVPAFEISRPPLKWPPIKFDAVFVDVWRRGGATSDSPVRLVLDPVLGNAQARELRDDRFQEARGGLLALGRGLPLVPDADRRAADVGDARVGIGNEFLKQLARDSACPHLRSEDGRVFLTGQGVHDVQARRVLALQLDELFPKGDVLPGLVRVDERVP